MDVLSFQGRVESHGRSRERKMQVVEKYIVFENEEKPPPSLLFVPIIPRDVDVHVEGVNITKKCSNVPKSR